MPTQLSACPICGNSRTVPFRIDRLLVNGSGNVVHLAECVQCSHVYLNPQPAGAELDPFYTDEYFDDMIPATAGGFQGQVQESRYNHARVVPGGRFLDIGCATGSMVAAMRGLGMEAQGVELSPIAVARARARGLDVICGTLESAALHGGRYDVVTSYHVLEHVPEPMAFLCECHRIMRPGGELVIAVPNLDSAVLSLVGRAWSHLDAPRHLHHFRPTVLASALQAAGFTVDRLETESYSQHVEGELAEWLRRRLFIPRRVTRSTHLMRPVSAWLTRRGMASGRGEAVIATCHKS